MPPYNAHHPASVPAAKFRASHATMHFTPYSDTTCITHGSSYTNRRCCIKDRSCAYCNEEAHITRSCACKRSDKPYQAAVLAAKTAAESLYTMAQTKKENSAPATTRTSDTPATTPTPASQYPHIHTNAMEVPDSEQDGEIVELQLITDTELDPCDSDCQDYNMDRYGSKQR